MRRGQADQEAETAQDDQDRSSRGTPPAAGLGAEEIAAGLERRSWSRWNPW